jgi:succinate dehydrogenase/fumarate reductase flavoprotein subunit
MMTEALERSVRKKGIPIIDGMQAFKLFVNGGRLAGVLAIDLSKTSDHTKSTESCETFVFFRCNNAILATGGPACVYHASVYPESQTGMTGMAIDAGIELSNFSEWQYGLASVGFRWNVSGTYQQVLPRYIAVDRNGAEREFLNDYFDDPFQAADMVFLKGYQWPFDVMKICWSSLIDLIVHHETTVLGNHVYMDFTKNPSCIDIEGFSRLNKITKDYLSNSGALTATPIERLRIMNRPAIELFRKNGIDITKEPLEVAVCAQHCNGGLTVDANWQTSIEGLYAAGEVAGTFGVYRPGGSALNSAQVGSMRAAMHIAGKADEKSKNDNNSIDLPAAELEEFLSGITALFSGDRIIDFRDRQLFLQKEMSRCAAQIRDKDAILNLANLIQNELDSVFSSGCAPGDLPGLLKFRDMLLTQLALLSAILKAAKTFGSRGSSFLINQDAIEVSEKLKIYKYEPAKEGV